MKTWITYNLAALGLLASVSVAQAEHKIMGLTFGKKGKATPAQAAAVAPASPASPVASNVVAAAGSIQQANQAERIPGWARLTPGYGNGVNGAGIQQVASENMVVPAIPAAGTRARGGAYSIDQSVPIDGKGRPDFTRVNAEQPVPVQPVETAEPTFLQENPFEWQNDFYDSCSPYCGNPCGGLRPYSGLYGSLDMVALERVRTNSVVLSDVVSGTGALGDQLNSNDDSFRFDPGLRARIGWQLDLNAAIESNYYGLYDWYGRSSIATPDASSTLSSQFLRNTGGVQTLQSMLYNSQLYSADLNWRYRSDPECAVIGSLLFGGRYIRLDESLTLQGSGGGNVETTVADASNGLIGGQIGGDLLWNFRCYRWECNAGADLKTGLFANTAGNRLTNQVSAGGVQTDILNRANDEVVLSSMVDLNFFVTMRYKCLAIRAGYQMLYLGGISLAPEQLVTTGADIGNGTVGPLTANSLNHDGSALYHGPFVGAEFTFPAGVR